MISKALEMSRFFYNHFKWITVDAILATALMLLFTTLEVATWLMVLPIFLFVLSVGIRGYNHGASHAFDDFSNKIDAMENLQEKVFLNSVFAAAMDKYRIRSRKGSNIQ